MSDPAFPFEPNHDVEEERASLGPMNRRELIVSVALIAVAAVAAGIAGGIGALIALLGGGLPGYLMLFLPALVVLATAVLVAVRLRSRRRGWPVATAGLVVVLAVAASCATVWAASDGVG